jgi:hypothetical protein
MPDLTIEEIEAELKEIHENTQNELIIFDFDESISFTSQIEQFIEDARDRTKISMLAKILREVIKNRSPDLESDGVSSITVTSNLDELVESARILTEKLERSNREEIHMLAVNWQDVHKICGGGCANFIR